MNKSFIRPKHSKSTNTPENWIQATKKIVATKQNSLSGSAPSGYVDFKFISLPLAIVRIDCTIVRVFEPQRLLVVLRNGILKSVSNLT
jgi:hypothetical protein